MRFIVDAYRYLIYAYCGLLLVAGFLIVLAMLDQRNSVAAQLSAPVIIGVLAAFTLIVLTLGGVAILFSIHDRHAELVEESERATEALQRIAAALERDSVAGERL